MICRVDKLNSKSSHGIFEDYRIVYNENKRRTKQMEREKMNLSKIHHIAIIVSDYEAAKNFYVNRMSGSDPMKYS